MKKIILSALISIAAICTASAQRGFNFQGVSQEKDKEITIVFDFINTYNDEVKYSEQHTAKTNADGVFSVVMGEGSPLIDGTNFSWLWWESEDYKLRTSINGEVVGTTKFYSVPYAKVAEKLLEPDKLTIQNSSQIKELEYVVSELREQVKNVANLSSNQVMEIVQPYVDMMDAEVRERIGMETATLQQIITTQQNEIDILKADNDKQKVQIEELESKCKSNETMIYDLQNRLKQLIEEVEILKNK